MKRTINRRHFFTATCGLLLWNIAPQAFAAGRTYKSKNEENKSSLELCRLRRHEYVDGGTNCIYQRQTGGKDAVIRVDDAKVRCQSEYQCKRIK